MNKVYLVYRESYVYEKGLVRIFSNHEAARSFAERLNDKEIADAEADELDEPMHSYYVTERTVYDKDPDDTKQEA